MTTQTFCSVLKNSSRQLCTISVIYSFGWALICSAQDDPETLHIGPPPSVGTSYTLESGILETAGTRVGPQGTFEHTGGAHVVAGPLQLQGGNVLSGGGTAYAFYTLHGGHVLAHTVEVTVGVFAQNGGTNSAGELILGPHNAQCTFQLNAGELETQRTFVYGSWRGGFKQSGGRHRIAQQLSVSGDSFQRAVYTLAAGELHCADIEVRFGSFEQTAGQLVQSGILILDNAIWEVTGQDQKLGALQLAGEAAAESTIRLAGERGRLQFEPSSSTDWSTDASLVIEGWNGSMRGGGAEQVVFGSDAQSLTPAQLSRVIFRNPTGAAPGDFPARLLPTGELVPGPFLESTANGSTMQLKWDTGYVLQGAENCSGPFEDVVGASSPFAYDGSNGIRYFRLRR
ncbi:MAG TPA: hypothetical protein VEH04_09230 [Verrucomicrobiae bacterium]|nr:hypothetical protein [Verrucomicrobiae bacterium]